MPITRRPRKLTAPAAPVIDAKVIQKTKAEESPLVIIPKEDAQILEAVAAGDLPEHAVMDAFPDMSRKAARVYAANTVQRYNDVLIQALERQGVDVNTVAAKIAEQMEAMTPLTYKGERTGAVVVDGAARRWAVDTVLDILPGARAPKQLEVKKTSLEAIILKVQAEDGDDD